MTEYEKFPHYNRSDRAPTGVCEITVQVMTHRAFDIQVDVERALQQHVDSQIETGAFEIDGTNQQDRLVIYTGTDRLGIDELRDIAEAYGNITQYPKGNIPPNMALLTTTSAETGDNPRAWLEFKLQGEMPTKEVEEVLREELGRIDLTPRHPDGDDMLAVRFREANYSYQQVRYLVNRAMVIKDKLPTEFIQIVCEGPRP